MSDTILFMNTPTHITLALATLGKKDKPKNNIWIFAGALVPDIAMFFLFFYEMIIGTPQRIIWDEKYFSPLWQNTVDMFNSFPIFVALLLVSVYKKWNLLTIFCLASMLHIAGDFPLHNDDAHRHFYPFSNWRFESPVSYWDPNFYGQYWSIFEIFLLLFTGYFAYTILQTTWARTILILLVVLSVTMFLFFSFIFSGQI